MKRNFVVGLDFFLQFIAPIAAIVGYLSRRCAMFGVTRSQSIFAKFGVLPIIDHYYEPRFKNFSNLERKRYLSGIDLRLEDQLKLLDSFTYWDDFKGFIDNGGYNINNGMFGLVDSFILYSFIRKIHPSRVVEIGSGFSTLVVQEAIEKNSDKGFNCEHLVIEPYPPKFLNNLTNIKILPVKVEHSKYDFSDLESGDLLFIDSSHMFAPSNDVDKEFLEILPLLQSGCYVHVHDVFTPYNYPSAWLVGQRKLWNEQYILEAFLTCNNKYHIEFCNFLISKDHKEKLISVTSPSLKEELGCSIYLRKI